MSRFSCVSVSCGLRTARPALLSCGKAALWTETCSFCRDAFPPRVLPPRPPPGFLGVSSLRYLIISNYDHLQLSLLFFLKGSSLSLLTAFLFESSSSLHSTPVSACTSLLMVSPDRGRQVPPCCQVPWIFLRAVFSPVFCTEDRSLFLTTCSCLGVHEPLSPGFILASFLFSLSSLCWLQLISQIPRSESPGTSWLSSPLSASPAAFTVPRAQTAS